MKNQIWNWGLFIVACVLAVMFFYYWPSKSDARTCMSEYGYRTACPPEAPPPNKVLAFGWMASGALLAFASMFALKPRPRCPHLGCKSPAPDFPIQGRMANGEWGYVQERCKKCDGLMMWNSNRERFVRWQDDVRR